MFGINLASGYWVILKNDLLPVTPSEITVEVEGRNETVDLLNGDQVSILKKPSLATISFEFLLPHTKYPFVKVDSLKSIKYYLEMIDELMTSQKPFAYMISRNMPDGTSIYATVLTVTMENYSYTESRDNGFDVVVSVDLKVYKGYETKTLTIEEEATEDTAAVVSVENETPREDTREIEQYYTVQSGDTLWKICQDFFDDGSRYSEVAALNNITNPNYITVGQRIKLYEVSE